MSTCISVLALVFTLGGVFGPANVPDGKGGNQVYDWAKKEDCVSVKHAVVFTSGNHGWKYYCRVK